MFETIFIIISLKCKISTKMNIIATSSNPVAIRHKKKLAVSFKTPIIPTNLLSKTYFRLVMYAKRTETTQAKTVLNTVPQPIREQIKYETIFTSVVQPPKNRYRIISLYLTNNSLRLFMTLMLLCMWIKK